MRIPYCSALGMIALLVTTPPVFAAAAGGGLAQRGSGQAAHGSQPKSHPSTPTGGNPAPKNNSIASRIQSHPQLESRVRALLPDGTTLETASSGFRNQGQFIAALHVSHNLGIPFDQLKTQMVTNGRSLGQSIQMLKPSADAKHEAKRGETEAKQDLAGKS